MITCPKCGASSASGASDCAKCGYGFSASESDPAFSPEKVFNWWLVFYAFWRIFALVTNVLAAWRSPEAIAQVFFSGLAGLSFASLLSLLLLWRRRKLGLYAFIASEIALAVWLLVFGQYGTFFYPLVAVLIMWVVTGKAKVLR